MIRILALCSPGEVRVAAWDGGMLLDYGIWRPGLPDGVGDVLRGRVLAQVPALAGAFVELPGTEGFLPDSDGAAGVPEGTVLTVRITRAAQGSKGPRLTARLPQHPGPSGLLERGPGMVELMAARHPDAPVLADDPAVVATLRPALGGRIQMAAHLLDPELDAQIAALSQPGAALPGGGRASFHPTPALVAIDVDTAAATQDRRAKAIVQHQANLAALPELARQIRLRNLSGAILIDLAGMNAKRRATLAPALAAALATDPLQPRLLGFTALGLAEIVRRRVHPPLHELLSGPHAAALSALRQIAQDSRRQPHLAFTLHASPAVLAALDADPDARPALERRTGRTLMIQPDPSLPPGGWHSEGHPPA